MKKIAVFIIEKWSIVTASAQLCLSQKQFDSTMTNLVEGISVEKGGGEEQVDRPAPHVHPHNAVLWGVLGVLGPGEENCKS